ncbi:F0F1 ATP synthase subunit A [candidate division WWE3 bacterium]|nr:F0F1 ATP synthase subunit A [candidate division WWE3 bacterium]
MEHTPHIVVAAEKLTEILGFPITNSLLTTGVVSLLIIILAFSLKSTLSIVPSKFQLVTEMITGWMYQTAKSISVSHVDEFFPIAMTLFVFILFSNWFGLLPGISGIGINIQNHGSTEFVPLFRAATTDINTTIALSLLVFIAVQYYGIRNAGFRGYISRFITFSSPINFYVGILELISEFSKTISLAFRLFGNIFAGEVLLTVISFLLPYIVPLPFTVLELFVGFIQAIVFAMLALVYMGGAVEYSHA